MKKQLLCTSAIALGVAAAPAAAQDWNLDWGGFYNTHVAIGDISTPGAPGTDFEGDGLDVHITGEIIFTPSIALDNGLTFGINVQYEAQNATNVDETYMSISSDSFGRLDIGGENSAGYKLMTGAPGVTSMFINSPSTSAFIPYTGVDAATGSLTALPFRQAGLSSFTEVAGNNDVPRITYYTPDFNGLTVGVSYAPDGSTNAGSTYSINKNTVVSDIFDIGVNYSGSFGSTDITLAARWGTGTTQSVVAGNSDPETWGVGASISFGAITVGASYNENDNDETLVRSVASAAGTETSFAVASDSATALGDSEGWSFGVVYDAAGPWAFEALTYQSETDIVTAAAAGAVSSIGADTGLDVERQAYRIGASRDLGPGVDWDIYVVYEERDDERSAGVTDIKGTVLGTAINLAF